MNVPYRAHRIFALTSGKGGVGKSTLTANLAIACAQRGFRVGLIDADVYGFSIPHLMGLVSDNTTISRPKRIGTSLLPAEAYGVKVISLGMLVESVDTAIAWRGPLLHRTLKQFTTQVRFGELDILFFDMPPGTGDVALSLGQLMPKAEILVVTTPQATAVNVAERSALIAHKMGQTVFGVIENMSDSVQNDGPTFTMFGRGAAETLSQKLSATVGYKVHSLGHVPLDTRVTACSDNGNPIVIQEKNNPASLEIEHIASQLLSSFS